MVNIAGGATALVTGAARLPAHLPPPPPLVPNDGVATGEDDVVVTKRGYALCESEVKRKILIDFFKSDYSINEYVEVVKSDAAAAGNKKIAGRTAIQNWIRDSGIGAMQRANKTAKKKNDPLPHSIEDATDKISQFISGVEQDKSDADKLRAELKMYLTLAEQQQILKSCAVLSALGLGFGEADITKVINITLAGREDIDEREAANVEVSAKVLRLMRKRCPGFGALRKGGSIDIARADKANEDTRDTMFMKLDEYVYLLYRMGLSPWERWADVPARNKYNMDEVGTDTTKRRKKIYAEESFLPLFRRTAEGDGKMNRHITLCTTTRADGKSCLLHIYLYIDMCNRSTWTDPFISLHVRVLLFIYCIFQYRSLPAPRGKQV